MKLRTLLILILIFCISCTSKVFTTTAMDKEFTANVGDTVMQWEILKRERVTKQKLAYGGIYQGFTIFKLYTFKPGTTVKVRDLKYDLNFSKYVNYKGAEIEIKDVTPKRIRYVVRAPFKGRQDNF